MSSRLLYRVSFLYLALPVLIFLLTWLRLWLGLICALVVVLALIQVWRERQGDSRLERRGILGGLLLLALWAWLSGVGGYAFQNSDHYCRNAVLRDLVNYSWPVVYRETVGGSPQMLVYYFGHWLPAALVGKWLGWEAANAALFVWTWAGVVLAGLLLGQRLRWPLWNAALLWIFFSSMDPWQSCCLFGAGTPRFGHRSSIWRRGPWGRGIPRSRRSSSGYTIRRSRPECAPHCWSTGHREATSFSFGGCASFLPRFRESACCLS